MNMNKEQILYLKKQGLFWHMDKYIFYPFYSYISRYFIPKDASTGIEIEKVCYVEISHADLYELSGIFGGYLSDNETLALIPLNNPATPWGSMISLIVYELIGEVCTPRKVIMVQRSQSRQKKCF